MSRHLLRLANRGDSRGVFLRDASAAMLRFTRAKKLDLWFEDGDLLFHCESSDGSTPEFRLTNLSLSPAGRRDSGENLGIAAGKLPGAVSSLLNKRERPQVDTGSEPIDSFQSGGTIIVPFEIDSRNEGVLQLTGLHPEASTDPCIDSCEDLAQLLGVAISNRRTRVALMERVKELDAMYRIAHIAAEPNIESDDMFQEIVELLPFALQYPDFATARITLGSKLFCSTGFEEGPHHLVADIVGNNKSRGQVEVFYRETQTHSFDDIQLVAEEYFLTEEQHLLTGVARELNSIIDHQRAEKEKLQLQSQIRHADRLVTIGQLAAGVAHELNEPLGNILGFAQLANKTPDLPTQTRSDLEKIEKASLYAREIIRKLMLFSRQTPSRMTEVNLNDVISDSLSLLESRCEAADIEVISNLGSTLPLVHGDRSQLQQVLVNLSVNAIQAMPTGGTLNISTQQHQDHLCLTVEDTGSGIAADDLKNIFLPFFTTKDVGEGTGLGLSVVHGIVNSHGGSINVESRVNKGTKFVIRFPKQQTDPNNED